MVFMKIVALCFRLPVFQGPSASFVVPLLAIQAESAWVCDDITGKLQLL